MRQANGGASASRRVVGHVFPARHPGLKGSRQAMNQVAPPRLTRVRAAVTVVVGLVAAGAVLGALWAWIAPPIRGVIAMTKSGERVHASLGNEADNFFVAPFLLVGMVVVLAVVT